ncbi:hypothetical protein BDW22DRAFT_1342277 [Trametopsis cervina]|nr:hypothetical protein BDW22DRAFT_1342277 [Trametopsis cervina]
MSVKLGYCTLVLAFNHHELSTTMQTELRREIAIVKGGLAQIDAVQTTMTAGISQLQTSQIATQTDVTAMKADIDQLQTTQTAIQAGVAAIWSTLDKLDARVRNTQLQRWNRARSDRRGPLYMLHKVNEGNGNPLGISADGSPSVQDFIAGEIGEIFSAAGVQVQAQGLTHNVINRMVYFYNDTMGITPQDNLHRRRDKVEMWLQGREVMW